MLVFRKTYFVAALLLFAAEVCIALFFHDRFIRPYFGDFLVVILIYCFLKSFWNASMFIVALTVLNEATLSSRKTDWFKKFTSFF